MDKQKRHRQLMFRVTEHELAEVKDKVAESGMKQQEYLRRCALDKVIYNTDGLREVLTEMRRQGSNLNQLARNQNMYGHADEDEIQQMMKEVQETWQSLRQALQKLQ